MLRSRNNGTRSSITFFSEYPFDYGFIPNTLAEDGAPLDAMVIMDEPTFAGCLIKARPIGVLDMHDCGAYDGKLLCVPIANARQPI